MKTAENKGEITTDNKPYKVYGTVRNTFQKPFNDVLVKVYDKDIRSEQFLGECYTNEAGYYLVEYTHKQFAKTDKNAADIIVRVNNEKEELLKESDTYFNAPWELEVNIDLSGKTYQGKSAFEQIVETIKPYLGKLNISQLTETDKIQDISFLTNKTNLLHDQVEQIAMAFRFEKLSHIQAYVYYGMLRENLPNNTAASFVINSPLTDFETKVSTIFDALMHTPIDNLMNGLKNAITDNIVSYAVTAELPKIKEMLQEQIQSYLKEHPGTGDPSTIYQNLLLGGLTEKEIQAFIEQYTSSGDPNNFWNNLFNHKTFGRAKANNLHAVFTLSQITGGHSKLTSHLVKSLKPSSIQDLKKLAGNTSADWEQLLTKHAIDPPVTTKGANKSEKIKNYANRLESNFTQKFPTAAFHARLTKDTSKTFSNKKALVTFFERNPEFDLLNDRIGEFLKHHPFSAKEDVALTTQLRAIQRIFKLSPDFQITHTLISDGIHSARQIYEMGPERFVKNYGELAGVKQANEIYAKAAKAHALSVALLGNLKSLSDASALNVFPDYKKIMKSGMAVELPNLETLFGHADSCECDECNSVYGAAAYLTDMLHYLNLRTSDIVCKPGKKASVKDILLQRRPDLGDIDLNCDNTNTEIPYIDISCEIMEDYISLPAVIISSALLPKLTKGPIDSALLSAITSLFSGSGQTNVSSLLTANARVSDQFTYTRLNNANACVSENHWIIRDMLLVLKATDLGASGIEIKLVHQTLLSTDEVSANPEYVNANTYNNFLKTAKRPFALPFDLFETEGELYLQKLGNSKTNLINIFRKEHESPVNPSVTDLAVAYAYLGVNETEQTLIFQQDLLNQTIYWGSIASGTSVQVDIFEQATGLTYGQIVDLLGLTFINPDKNSLIEHDNLSCDTDTQHITNLTPAKFDAIHRFLRLWRKTNLLMSELNAIILAPAIGNGKIEPKIAWALQNFLVIQKSYSFTAFQLLAFYQNIDTNGLESLYYQIFQNRFITNPVNPDFSVANVTAGLLPISDTDKATIIASLGITNDDLLVLIGKTNAKLSLTNLSGFYRTLQLISALQLSLSDWMNLLDLINIDPFKDPYSTNQFLQKYQTLVASGFSVDELNYVLRQQQDANKSLIPADSQVIINLTELQNGILQIRANTLVQPDTTGTLLNKWLSDPLLKWDNRLLLKLMDILNTTDDVEYLNKIDNNLLFLRNLRIQFHDSIVTADLSNTPDLTVFTDYTSQIFYDSGNKQLSWIGYMSAADKATLISGASADFVTAVNQLFIAAQQTSSSNDNKFIVSDPADFLTLKSMIDGLPSQTTTKSIADRFKFFLVKVSPLYTTIQQQSFLQNEIVKWFTADKLVVNNLINLIPAIYNDFTDNNFVNKVLVLNSFNYPNQFIQYLLLSKICFIANKLKLTADDLNFLLVHASDLNSLDFLSLPVSAIVTPINTFVNFEVLVNILKFEQSYPTVVTDITTGTTLSVYSILLDAINNATTTSIETDVVQLTGWNKIDLDKLINVPNYLNISNPVSTDLKKIDILVHLDQCFQSLMQMGVSSDDAVAWCKPSLSLDDATKIKQTLKAQYTVTDWLSVTQPLQNTLREKKRDTLITYLLANPGSQNWVTDNDLYGHFLLDLEMSSCQPTSRIVQATNSVQLFVQRCFLSLESDVIVDAKADSVWLQWEWMKNFRVWQANRKVFLYPENWIEPELLPVEIKSSFLQDLENDLLQNEVTKQNVEDAFQNYLEKLDEVARLEVKGMWYDDPSKTLFVFARTYGGDPKTYYFRKYVENRRWTPWQKVDLDIESDDIIPVVYNERVYLFWAVFTDQTESPSDADLTPPTASGGKFPPSARPKKFWRIQLAFSEYKNGKWSPKKISNNDETGYIEYPDEGSRYDSTPDKSVFIFTPLDIPVIDFSHFFNANGKPVDTKTFASTILEDIKLALEENGSLQIHCYVWNRRYNPVGTFELDPCRGYPVVVDKNVYIYPTLFDRSDLDSMLDTEIGSDPNDALSVSNFPILNQTPGDFRNLIPLQMGFLDRLFNIIYQILYYGSYRKVGDSIGRGGIPVTLGTFLPYFYQDQSRTYYVAPELSDNASFEFFDSDLEDLFLAVLDQNTEAIQKILNEIPQGSQIYLLQHFYNFHHPLVCYFMRQLFKAGIDGLMDRKTQLKGDVAYDSSLNKFNFQKYFEPTPVVYSDALQPVTYANGIVDTTPGYPKDDVDFDLQSGYGLYNWELFFHAPLMIAERLSNNQQFEDADHWFRYIFNPTDASSYPSPDKYWTTKPFFINTNDKYTKQRIENIMLGINAGNSDLVKNVDDWRNNPFQPHYIAEYRTVAYQKTAVMKYLDHLIRWGDYLFQQHTMESVNEATQIYVLADQILGPQPQVIPPAYELPVDNYYQLEFKIDAFSNKMVDIENLLPLQEIKGYIGVQPGPGLPALQTLYFCIPINENLIGPLGYWNTVADRLFKIRHCLDISGTFAPLSLFAPPINPALLVRAAAAGLDLSSVLNDMNSPLPSYRFSIMMQKATELCNEVKSLGTGLLSALEKKDAEAMALLRSTHEIKLLNAVLIIKQKQIDDAQSNLDNLTKQKELTTIRRDYYQNLITNGLISNESIALDLSVASTVIDTAIAAGHILAGGLKAIPGFLVGASGFGGSPVASVSIGDGQFGDAAEIAVHTLSAIALSLDKMASLASTNATYERRAQDWQYQLNAASKELEQIDIQINGASIRLDIANVDLKNQQLQIDNAQEENDFMHSKYTNQDLYNWMVTQISSTYFRSYQLAYDVAKRSERCFRYELGLSDSYYINFGYWDSLKKGLLSGEQLGYDLKKMEMDYYEQNKREYELTKHISIAQFDPVALLKLITNGDCWINLPEELFDMDYPGHYMRRIKAVSITIPCITGPYTTVSFKLTQTKNSIRTTGIAPSNVSDYKRKSKNGVPLDDPRFRDSVGIIQSIATSNAQNDNGLFELNFHDERYLPFEGSGAISLWHLELPAAIKQFDYSTISDVIIHLKYTSRDGGDALKGYATQSLAIWINKMLVSTQDSGLMRIFSVKHEFPTEWYQFLNPASKIDDQVLSISLTTDRLPFFTQGRIIKIQTIEIIADSTVVPIKNLIADPVPSTPPNPQSLNKDLIYGNYIRTSLNYSSGNQLPITWKLTNKASNARLTSDQLNDMMIIVHFNVS
jgi:hypothetical protein